ncbi:hypothetical protein [Streptomyces sp. NPDC094032]|uniref:zinc finger domain-containing protein n=1 Tax=Streptomyces sp. NPDC094032 TaxID=3155308 RepID=UPI0033266163
MTDRARSLPQLAVACPTRGAAPGEPCTSHGGTRPRRTHTHVSRRAAWATSRKDTRR